MIDISTFVFVLIFLSQKFVSIMIVWMEIAMRGYVVHHLINIAD